MKTCLYSHKFKLLYHSSRAISIAISCAFAKIEEFSQSARSVSGKTTVFLSVVFITEKLWRSVFSHKRIIPPHGEQQNGIAVCHNRRADTAGKSSFKIPLKTVDNRLELRRKREVIDRRGDEKQITRAQVTIKFIEVAKRAAVCFLAISAGDTRMNIHFANVK